MKQYILRRYMVTDLGRFNFPDENLNENQKALHIEFYSKTQNFEIDLESKERDIIQFSKIDKKGNLLIASIEPIAA